MSEITRGEFDLLKDIVTGNQARMDSIDAHGSRGVAVLQEQVTELIKDMVQLKAGMEGWQAAHEVEHQAEKRERMTGRRWLIGIGFAGAASMAGVAAALADIITKIH